MCEKHLKKPTEGDSEPKTAIPPRTVFDLSEIEDAFKNFALDVLDIADHEEREDRWDEFEEYFK